MIKLFTMVKDESDIIRDWILYHGYIFGFENLFIIDNMSSDGTFEIINEYSEKGIKIYRELNYIEKGRLMKRLIDGNCEGNDVAFPIDIDEFIVYYDSELKEVNCDKMRINNYINDLGNVGRIYKANYIQNIISQKVVIKELFVRIIMEFIVITVIMQNHFSVLIYIMVI